VASCGHVELVASCGHVLRFADVRDTVTAATRCQNYDLVESVNLVRDDSLCLRRFITDASSFEHCGWHSSWSVFDYSFSVLYQGLHRSQYLCREITCPRSFFWVSVGCAFLLFLRLVFSYFCSASRYSKSFSMYNKRAIDYWPVPHSIVCTEDIPSISLPYGGGGQHKFAFEDIAPYVVQGDTGSTKNSFKFVVHGKHIGTSKYDSEAFVHTNVPLRNIIHRLSIKTILDIAQIHGIKIASHVPKAVMVTYFDTHYCETCNDAITIFSVVRVGKLVPDRTRNQIVTDNTCIKPEITEHACNSVQQGNPPPSQTGKARVPMNRTTEVEQNSDEGFCERPVQDRSMQTRATGRGQHNFAFEDITLVLDS